MERGGFYMKTRRAGRIYDTHNALAHSRYQPNSAINFDFYVLLEVMAGRQPPFAV